MFRFIFLSSVAYAKYFRYVVTNSDVRCKNACLLDLDCIYWNYNKENKHCAFKLDDKQGSVVVKDQGSSCGKWEKYDAFGDPHLIPEHTPETVADGLKYTGTGILNDRGYERMVKVNNERDCLEMCQLDVDCKCWTYYNDKEIDRPNFCYLKRDHEQLSGGAYKEFSYSGCTEIDRPNFCYLNRDHEQLSGGAYKEFSYSGCTEIDWRKENIELYGGDIINDSDEQ